MKISLYWVGSQFESNANDFLSLFSSSHDVAEAQVGAGTGVSTSERASHAVPIGSHVALDDATLECPKSGLNSPAVSSVEG